MWNGGVMMNKGELIEAIVAKTGATKKDAEAIVKATFDSSSYGYYMVEYRCRKLTCPYKL